MHKKVHESAKKQKRKQKESKMKQYKNQKSRHHVETFEVFECFSSLCFYVVMICIFENQFFFLGAKLIIKLIQIKKKAVFYAKKNVNVCKFCPRNKGPCLIREKVVTFRMVKLNMLLSIFLITK